MQHILDYTQIELRNILKEHSLPAFRADQILKWIYQEKVTNFDQMTNLPKLLRDKLAENFHIRSSTEKQTLTATDGAIKTLLQWPDDTLTETVLMPSNNPNRNTACLSSQVGCPVKCAFCASGLQGLQRSLTAGEIVEQALWAAQTLPEQSRLSNIVIMGMGEPLANYKNTIRAARILNADWGLNIAARHITISTVGIPDQIRKLANEPMQITLAVSLHSGDQSIRDELIPWSQKNPLPEIFDALKEYYKTTHREVTLEYVLLDGVNDTIQDAEQLAHWSRKVRSNVNLIKYNPVDQTRFAPPSDKTCQAFLNRLTELGVNTHLRKSKGQDINAACGQLRQHNL